MKITDEQINLISTVIVATLLLLVAGSFVTLLYWMSGGEFKRSGNLAVYAMCQVYVLLSVIKISYDKHKPDEPCRVCGCKSKS